MTDVQLKYQKLDSFAQKEVDDFIDFLLQKRAKREFDMDKFKENLLKISVWSEEDVKAIEDGAKHFDWKIEEW